MPRIGKGQAAINRSSKAAARPAVALLATRAVVHLTEVFTSHDLNAESFLSVMAGWPLVLCPCRNSQIGGDVIRFADVHRDGAQPHLAASSTAAGELP